MKKQENKYRFLFAGGGTGGHIFPAIAVAEQIRALKPEAEILFVGTKTRIEATAVPKAGFKFKSIWIKGFARKFNLENILFPLKVMVSMCQSLLINMKFKPRVAIGSGGYVSGPAVWGASVMGAKVILLEQNSYPGVTTRLLERKASQIHISFEESKKYLRKKELAILTGNPVRSSLHLMDRKDALNYFGLKPERKTLLILGGSLGAGTVNKAVESALENLVNAGIQVIWQTGKNYFDSYSHIKKEGIWLNPFIDNMSAAFSACDLLVSRAGATTIAELSSLGLAAILVPSPNVAANHQYHNAKALSDKGAALLITDDNIRNDLTKAVTEVIFDDSKLNTLKEKIRQFGKPDAAYIIANNAIKLAESI